MSTLVIAEFADRIGGTSLLTPEVATQSVTFTTVSQQSAAFNANTKFVRVWSDVDCSLSFGKNPTAITLQGIKLTAKVPEVFCVSVSNVDTTKLKVAVIT